MKILLIVLFFNPGGGIPVQTTTEMQSWSQCIEAVSQSKFQVGSGDENEVSGAMFCAMEPVKHSRPKSD